MILFLGICAVLFYVHFQGYKYSKEKLWQKMFFILASYGLCLKRNAVYYLPSHHYRLFLFHKVVEKECIGIPMDIFYAPMNRKDYCFLNALTVTFIGLSYLLGRNKR